MNRRRLLQLGAGLAGAAALAACKKSEPSSTSASASSTTVSATESSTVTSATTAASSTSAAATTTATSAPALAADRTAILRFGAMRGTSYDPMRVGTQTEYPQLNVIYDTLISIDPTNSEFLPRLATKWEPQGDRLRLTLRTGVTFQDGTPLDAEAVKFSMDRARTDPESTISARMTNIVSVDVVDASTVDIVLKTPEFLPLLILLADRPGMIVSPTAVKAAGNSEAFSKAPIGAGMYKVTGEWLPREKMSVRAWDGYWDKEAAALGGIDFSEIAMAAALNALRADEVDMGSYQGADAQTIENDKALRLKVGYAPLIKGLVINITKAPFDNVKVRQAISYAIDREAAVKALTFGYGRPAYQMFAQESLGYDPALEGFYKYDPEKAKALLAEAGFPDGVSFDSIIGSTSAPYVQFGQFLQANLKKANITMNLSLEDPSTVIPRLYAEGSAASAPIATSGAVVDTTIRLSLLAGGPTNASKLETPGVKELVDKAALAKTVEEARTYYQQISRIQVEGVYSIIPVFNEPALLGYH
ncbi:MAG TPA: ABC transporter substrate-binding protein, partial [Ilumatobacteraceae bacterium]|nr:ABC transporter substrate-binding protein [Ilumatobacteraceae bacterium]